MTLQYISSFRTFLATLLFVVVAAYSGQVMAQKYQSDLEKNLHQDALAKMSMADYYGAIKNYQKILEVTQKNPRYNYEMGVALYRSARDKDKAAKYLENAVRYSVPDDTIPELFYYLGKALQWNHNFKPAIKAYKRFLPNVKNNRAGRKLKEEVEWNIKTCQHGVYHVRLNTKNPLENTTKPLNDVKKYYTSSQDYVVFENLGNIINSSQDDYAAIFMKNENEIIFTSRRIDPTSTETFFYDQLPYEEVYVSRKVGEKWKSPVRASASNMFGQSADKKETHMSNTAMAKDGTELYVVLDNELNYASQMSPGQWNELSPLGENINQKKAKISGCYVTNDGKRMLISVQLKKEGFGEYDLYESYRQADGTWGPMTNLGAVINTKRNEVSPYLEDNVLWFSSEGHSSIGGYDVFYSIYEDGKWSNPKNLGIPINSPADELYYIRSNDDRNSAFYSSGRRDGYGNLDIYQIQSHSQDIKRDELALALGGDFEFDETGRPIVPSEPEEPKEELAQDTTQLVEPAIDSTTVAVAEPETPESEQETPESETENTKESTKKPDVEDKKEVEQPKEPKKETPTPTPPKQAIDKDVKELLANIEFGFNDKQLDSEQKERIKRIREYLEEHPDYVLNLAGHADYLGSEEVNMAVSKRRALLVFDALVEEGADPVRVSYAYFGESKPLVPGKSETGEDLPDNRAKNRRVELGVEKLAMFRYITFGFDSDNLSAEAKATLEEVAQFLSNNSYSKVELNGFTDNIGNADYNKALAKRRANSALNFLKEKGIDTTNITVSSFGQESPATPHNQALNRRVEIKVRK